MLKPTRQYSMLQGSSDLTHAFARSNPARDSAGIFAYCILLIAISLAVLCYVTSYWIINDYPPSTAKGRFHQGILAECISEDCRWYFDVPRGIVPRGIYLGAHMPDWFKATQGLMTIGLGLGLLALLVATMSLCCTCHSCNANHPICALLIISCLSMSAGICIFGVKANDSWNIDIEWSYNSQGRFGWSFWVGIGASALALLTGCMYGCMGRKQH